MEGHSVYSEGGTEKSNLQDNLAFLSAESGKDEPIICHVEKLVDAHASSEPYTYQGPCQDLGRHEEQESCMSIPMQAKESGGIFYLFWIKLLICFGIISVVQYIAVKSS